MRTLRVREVFRERRCRYLSLNMNENNAGNQIDLKTEVRKHMKLSRNNEEK